MQTYGSPAPSRKSSTNAKKGQNPKQPKDRHPAPSVGPSKSPAQSVQERMLKSIRGK